MKNKTNERERFHKPFYFLSATRGKLFRALREVFQNFPPGDFMKNLNQWQHMALCNGQSTYDEAGAREDLLDVTDALKKMVECWHIILIRKVVKKRKPATKLKRLQRKMLQQDGIVYTLTKAEQAKPMRFLRKFCKTFDRAYLEMELLDMLDAVITYHGPHESYKGNLVFFYQHLLYLVRLSYKTNKAAFCYSKQQHAQE
ncbi:MAG: hypothetical protein KF746_27045 [Chitinophagaceae bacterium]|nr:hypothetical protein [Chitinophagaceae bacterium]